MQISSISSIARIAPVVATSHASGSTTASPPATARTSIATPSAVSSSVQEDTPAAVYSATVAGKNYSGSVEETGGEYTASVASPPGASASGSSIELAENNLTVAIDEVV